LTDTTGKRTRSTRDLPERWEGKLEPYRYGAPRRERRQAGAVDQEIEIEKKISKRRESRTIPRQISYVGNGAEKAHGKKLRKWCVPERDESRKRERERGRKEGRNKDGKRQGQFFRNKRRESECIVGHFSTLDEKKKTKGEGDTFSQ